MIEETHLPGELAAGDLVDLAPVYESLSPGSDPDHVAWWRYEYARVIGVEMETADCVRVDHECGSFGIPADFRLTVVRGAS